MNPDHFPIQSRSTFLCAVELVGSELFEAVLLDIQMPEINGYETLTRFRRANFRKPTFALTACATKEERNRAIACGFSDHITKPVNSELLIQTLMAVKTLH